MQSTIQRYESYLCIDCSEETALQFGLQPQEFVYTTLGNICLLAPGQELDEATCFQTLPALDYWNRRMFEVNILAQTSDQGLVLVNTGADCF